MDPTAAPEPTGTGGAPPLTRTQPRRRLPAPRAVVGAMLVATAAVLAFTAHAAAGRAETVEVLVARSDLAAGTPISDAATARQAFAAREVLADGYATSRTIPAAGLDDLAGTTLASALTAGDPLLATVVAEAPIEGVTLTLVLPRAHALDGALQPGDRVTVLATEGASGRAVTDFVARDVLVRTARPGDAGLGSSTDVVITVVVATDAQARVLAHAQHTADLLLVRSNTSPAAPGGGDGTGVAAG